MTLRWAGEPLQRGDCRVRHLLFAVGVFATILVIIERIVGAPWLESLMYGALMWIFCSGFLLVKHWLRRRRETFGAVRT